MMPTSLGQGHIFCIFAPFCTWIFSNKTYNYENYNSCKPFRYSDQVPEGDTSVQLNTHPVKYRIS